MNILFITPYYSSTSSGGIESEVKTLSQSLSDSNHCVVIGPKLGKDEVSLENEVTIYRTQLVNPLADIKPRTKDCIDFFQKVIGQERIDKILAHNLHMWVHPSVVTSLVSVAADKDIPVYLRIHNFCHPSESTFLRTLRWQRILCMSQRLAEQIATLGVSEDFIGVVYTPIDTDLFCPKHSDDLRSMLSIPDDSVILLHASRLVGGPDVFHSKGFVSLLRVFSKMGKGHLVFCVSKPPVTLSKAFERQSQKIQEMATSLSLSDRVHLISSSYEEMPNIYNGVQIFVLLSQREAFGRVYAEASACGLPVVGTNVGGIPEAIKHGSTGFVVNNEKEACRSLEQLINNVDLRLQMGQAGITYVTKRFSTNVINRKLMQIFKTD